MKYRTNEMEKKHIGLVKEYARQSYLVSEENSPEEDEEKALDNVIENLHILRAEDRRVILEGVEEKIKEVPIANSTSYFTGSEVKELILQTIKQEEK